MRLPRNTKRRILMTALSALACWLPAAAGATASPIGARAPEAALVGEAGAEVELADHAGHPVLFLFARPDDEASEEKLSDIALIHDYYAESELRIVAAVVGQNGDEAAEYAEDLWLDYPLYGDPDGETARRYGVREFPAVVILDNEHAVRHRGPYPTDEALRRELLAWMDEKVFFVTGRQFEFEPNIISVNKGDRVLLKLISEDVAHGIYIDGYELYVKQRIDREGNVVAPEDAGHHILPGEMGLVRFTADKAGRFSLRCAATCANFHPYMYGWLRVKPNVRFPVSALLTLLLVGVSVVWFGGNGRRDRILSLFPIAGRFELTRYPLVRKMLKSRWPRFLAMIVTTFFFTVILVSCFTGGLIAGNFNFGIMFVWILWFVLLIMVMVPFCSRVFCSVCPLPLLGTWLQRRSLMGVKDRLYGLNRKFPKALQNMWMVNFLFLGVTFFNGYLTTLPIASFVMFAGIIVGATIVMFVFEKRVWCRYVCPVGGFQGLYSNAATLEVRCKDPEVCNRIKPGKEYTFENGIAACRLSCPAGVDASSYVALIHAGKYERALEVIREAMPFPGVCGRVCPAPCETECSRKRLDQPIAIRALKRFVADRIGRKGDTPKPFVPAYSEKVAVIGSGPAGLTCAYYLAQRGYAATVYESQPVIGGMFKTGLPDFHLPKDIVDREIGHIENAGVKFVPNTAVGKHISFASLRREYQAVFIAAGASQARRLKLEGEDLDGVSTAIDLLRDVNTGGKPAMGEKVVVLGGGKTAVDAARTALRLGAQEAVCLEMQSPRDLPPLEKQANQEGVSVRYLTAPVKILGSDGKVTSVLCQQMQKVEADTSAGGAEFTAVEGSETLISADTVIVAVGQYSDISFLPDELHVGDRGTIVVDEETMATNLPGVFAGGDVVSGPDVFVNAVKQGRTAALSIARHLRGATIEPVSLHPSARQTDDLPLYSIEHRDRVEPECLPTERRLENFEEVEQVFTEKMAREEAARCLGCGSCANCCRGNENGYGCPWLELPFRLRRNTYCGLCLECFKTCPEDNMAVNLRPPATDVLVDDKRGMDEAWKSFLMLGAAVVFYVFMMGPWGFLKDWQRGLTVSGLLTYMGISAVFTLLAVPALYGAFVLTTRWINRIGEIPYRKLFLDYSYSLVPLGLFTWIAFCFGFLLPSGSYVIHVISDPFAWGWNLFGTAGFPWTPFMTRWMPYLQTATLLFGAVFSVDIGLKISQRMFADEKRAILCFLPIAAFIAVWTIIMLWLFLW